MKTLSLSNSLSALGSRARDVFLTDTQFSGRAALQTGTGLLALIVGSAALLACGAAGDDTPGDDDPVTLGALTEPLCENKGGTNAVETALAVAAARELRRWSPSTDFAWNSSAGRLDLTSAGRARCADGACRNTQAVLDLQSPAANGVVTFPGNIKLDTSLLKSALQASWNAQKSCEAAGTCKAAAHDFVYSHVEDGSCEKKFFFDGYRAGTRTHLADSESNTLSNKLRFVGYPGNKMLNFYLRNGQVSVDPTYGLNEGATTTVGSCDAACAKFSPSDVNGRCCSCNGATKRYSRAVWNSSTYLCK